MPGKQTDPLLAHEQLHFDIAELYARRLLLTLNAETYHDDYKEQIRRIYDDLALERRAFQHKYDDESNHSKNKLKQAQWELYIKQQLEITKPPD